MSKAFKVYLIILFLFAISISITGCYDSLLASNDDEPIPTADWTPDFEALGFYTVCLENKTFEKIKFTSSPNFDKDCCLQYCFDYKQKLKLRFFDFNAETYFDIEADGWYSDCEGVCTHNDNRLVRGEQFFDDEQLVDLHRNNCLITSPILYNETKCIKETLVRDIEE